MSRQALKITTINKPMKRCAMWWGIAIDGDKNYEWFYEPDHGSAFEKKSRGFPVAL